MWVCLNMLGISNSHGCHQPFSRKNVVLAGNNNGNNGNNGNNLVIGYKKGKINVLDVIIILVIMVIMKVITSNTTMILKHSHLHECSSRIKVCSERFQVSGDKQEQQTVFDEFLGVRGAKNQKGIIS